ncbi:allantoicase [Trinickia caryophylli]|uniref:Probable allantoicase n=1 Tax=Trinickia caryophylli TaxID=28094 RepID=A0A1X7DN92_TRICW|nr:allantoicase [Trinickia caryophylli]PMS10657.1 allantoicase [Trinickia caryophylli]TRX17158.1 allantoicase [Trinickia caryophylli]WQE12109.1 allantoicase [Trinickia caryophylli]SMF18022.1 allantoicase [Trinickia caryophylli]GLU31763.1 putative allantoicase 1 [Trinickia caryophylli]
MALQISDPNAPEFTRRYANLADPRLGAEAIAASDEFFAPKERMLNPEPAVFVPGKYDDHGKWMDGWETRRKRTAGYDWCVIKLARAGVVKGVDLDTSHFTGNFPPAASIEAANVPDGGVPDASTRWTGIVASVSLQGNSHHYLDVQDCAVYTHLRLNLYPDGGIARLRVYGQPSIDWAGVGPDALVDLAALENGAYIVAANNQHFGAASNLLMPGRGVNMGDGWETRRRREPGNDWAIVALARPGTIKRIGVDTAHFKGNYPDRCSLQAAYVAGGTDSSLVTQAMFWSVLLDEQKLQMDHLHVFESGLAALGPVTHVRFNIVPDGGVSRLRLWGTVE